MGSLGEEGKGQSNWSVLSASCSPPPTAHTSVRAVTMTSRPLSTSHLNPSGSGSYGVGSTVTNERYGDHHPTVRKPLAETLGARGVSEFGHFDFGRVE